MCRNFRIQLRASRQARPGASTRDAPDQRRTRFSIFGVLLGALRFVPAAGFEIGSAGLFWLMNLIAI